MLQVLETWSFSKVLSESEKRLAPAGVSLLQGPGENEERYERLLVAAEVVTKKTEKTETKSQNVVEHGSAAIASDSHECGVEREEVDEKLLREREMRSLGIPFSKSVVVDRDG
jgi:hypothetical protein